MPSLAAALLLLTGRGRCREPGTAHQHGGCISTTSDFAVSVFLCGINNTTHNQQEASCVPSVYRTRWSRSSHGLCFLVGACLIWWVFLPRLLWFLFSKQCGAESCSRTSCACAAAFLRCAAWPMSVICVRRHHAAWPASGPGASPTFLHNGGPRPFLHSHWEIVFHQVKSDTCRRAAAGWKEELILRQRGQMRCSDVHKKDKTLRGSTCEQVSNVQTAGLKYFFTQFYAKLLNVLLTE